MSDRIEAIRSVLEAHGQDGLLATCSDLVGEERETLLQDLEQIDFETLDALIERYVRAAEETPVPQDLEPAPYYPCPPDPAYDADHHRALGDELIRQGKVAAFTVAGGQGTRLGWNGPKCSYPGTVVTGKPLFRCFAEQILASQRRYGVTIPWYIMTSPMNDADTRAFFADNNCFGLVRKNIFMFPQGVIPSIDMRSGRLMLADRCRIAVNPDGHGGSLRALRASGAIEDMSARGIEHISYFQVDNPLVRAIDPLFMGLHASAPDSSAQMSSKMVRKTDPDERVGVFCRSGGKTVVIEYSDLPPDLARQREEDGSLRFGAGSIAIHAVGVGFVEQLTEDPSGMALPLHRAEKKVSYYDPASAAVVEPQAPNAVKLEMFIFDALPMADSSIVMETARSEEFAPIKNRDGNDSPATSHQMQSDRHGAWLETHGVDVPRDEAGHVTAQIEISPLTAMEAADLEGVPLPRSIAPGEQVLL